MSYPHRIIHEAACAMKRQYQASLSSYAILLSPLAPMLRYRFDCSRNSIGAVVVVEGAPPAPRAVKCVYVYVYGVWEWAVNECLVKGQM
jgi:hypothetical protein